MKIDYEKYMGLLYAKAIAMMKNHHDAEDLVQDTILKCMTKEHLFDGKSPKSWMCKVMHHEMINKYRKKKRTVSLTTISTEIIERLAGEEDEPGRNEISDVVQNGLNELNECYRIVLELLAQDLSYKEIAEKINIPVGTVMSRICRAREQMRNELRAAA